MSTHDIKLDSKLHEVFYSVLNVNDIKWSIKTMIMEYILICVRHNGMNKLQMENSTVTF